MAVLLGLLRVLPTRIGIFLAHTYREVGAMSATHAHRDISPEPMPEPTVLPTRIGIFLLTSPQSSSPNGATHAHRDIFGKILKQLGFVLCYPRA